MRKIHKIGGVITVLVFGYFGLNHSWSIAAIHVFVSENTCDQRVLETAHKRVSGFLGEMGAQPRVLCLDDPVWGFNVTYGSARFAPLFPTIVVVGPKGQNQDVIAHELAHAEIAVRTSVLLRSYKMPTWFDEGMAMQVDHRPDYSAHALKEFLSNDIKTNLNLDEISTARGFYSAGDKGKMNYAFAKCVVGHWMSNHSGNPNTILSTLNWTDPFPIEQFLQSADYCSTP